MVKGLRVRLDGVGGKMVRMARQRRSRGAIGGDGELGLG